MPLIKSTPPEPGPHICQTPSRDGLGYGSLWLCPECGRVWKIAMFCTMTYWKHMSMWRSRRIAKRLDKGQLDG